MCSILSYGFTKNGSPALSGSTCSGVTTDTLGAQVSIGIDASDSGKTYVATVYLLLNNFPTGAYMYNSAPKYTGGISMWTFDIPFTGLVTNAGTYTFLDGCTYINTSDGLSQACFRCDTTRCIVLTITQSCTTPVCSFTIT